MPRLQSRPNVIAIALLVGAPIGLVAAQHASQDTVTAVTVTDVAAGQSVFASDQHRCQSAASAAWGYRQEPSLAVNPTDGRNMIAVWRQDQWGGALLEGEGGAALSDVTAYTTNGGASWTEVVLPDLGVCGPVGNGASDPTVSFGPDGTAYVAVMQHGIGPYDIAVLSYRSHDGGRTWDGPVTVQRADSVNDRPTIVADPDEHGRVYVVWFRFQPFATICPCAALVMARSDDGGLTWTKPTVVARPEDGFGATPAQLSVLPDGAFVALYSELSARAALRAGGTETATIRAARSEDGGATWSSSFVARYTMTDHSGQDPDTDHTIDAAEFFIEQADAADGTLYAVWHHNDSISQGQVRAVRSDDGGRTWTEPLTVADVPAQVLDPMIAVAEDGTVGVLWADLRNDDDVPDEGQDDDELTTDWWIATSPDRGESWQRTHVSGPFDLRHARFVRGNEERDRQPYYWIGEYSGFVSAPGGFAAAFIEAVEPRDDISQTRVRFARIRLRGLHR